MKILTTVIFAFIFLLTTLASTAQSKSDKMYDVFSGKDGVTNFSFSKSMIDAIDIDLGEDGDEQNVTGDLHQIRFMSFNPEKGNMTGSQFTQRAIGMLPSQYKKFEEDEDDDAEIWLLGKKKNFQECHVFTKNKEDDQLRIVVSFYGDFTVNDLDELKKTGKGFSDDN